jgi:hypothetical protein
MSKQQKIDERVRQYVACRDEIDKVEKRHKEELEPLQNLQKVLAGILQQFLDDTGVDSIKTEYGTAYATTRFSAALADPEAFMQHVIQNNSFELLDKRANVTAVKDYVKEHNTTPPGVNLSSITSIGVRRPAKAKE